MKYAKLHDKTKLSSLKTRFQMKGAHLVLGRTILREDDPGLDPARLWAPGLHDISPAAPADYASALFFALASAAPRAQPDRPVLLCEAETLAFEHGGLYAPGLHALGVDPAGLVMISARSERDLLWCAEEGLGCGAIAGLVLRLPARARVYDFTASRRLHLRALASGASLYVVRAAPCGEPAAAQTTWRIAAAPSVPSAYGSKRILGRARWKLALERARTSRAKDWVMGWDDETHRLHMAESVGDRLFLSQAS
jgi:protein ImuA